MTGEELFGIVVLMSIAFIVGYYVNIRTTMHTVRMLKQEYESEKKIMNEMHKLDKQSLYEKTMRLEIEICDVKEEEIEKRMKLNSFKLAILTYVTEKHEEVGETDKTLNDVLKIIRENRDDS